MGCDWTIRRSAPFRFSAVDWRGYHRALHHGELRRRLLRIAGHGDSAASADVALLRDVRTATHARARRAPAFADSDESWLQAGQVLDGFESHERTGPSRLLGRSRLFVVLRIVK